MAIRTQLQQGAIATQVTDPFIQYITRIHLNEIWIFAQKPIGLALILFGQHVTCGTY